MDIDFRSRRAEQLSLDLEIKVGYGEAKNEQFLPLINANLLRIRRSLVALEWVVGTATFIWLWDRFSPIIFG